MNQKNPLLNYRKKCNPEDNKNYDKISYDFKSGLWKNELGEPIIEKYIDNSELKVCQGTLITESREGIDRSEISNLEDGYQESDNIRKELTLTGQTLITRTREGIDRSSEISDENNYLNMSSTVTFTRESVDRSEIS